MGVARWEPCNCLMGIKTGGGRGFRLLHQENNSNWRAVCLQVSACQKRLSWSDWAPAAAVEDGTDTKSMLSRVGRGGTRRAGTLLTADLSSMSFSTSAPPPPPSLRHYRQLFPGRFEGIGSARSILEHPPQKNKTTAGEQRGFSSFTIKQTSKKRRIRQPNPDVCSTNSFIRSCFDKLRFRYLYSKSFKALSHTKGEVSTLFFLKKKPFGNNNVICFITKS